MEAKVDIRKLQLLNDRICQTIEALNQVRVSVHSLGLSHSSPQMGAYGSPFAGVGPIGQPVGYGAQIPQGPYYGQPQMTPYGLQHTNPAAAFGFGQIGQFGPLGPIGFGGLQHTSPVDVIESQRLAQTFPFAFAFGTPTLW